MSIIHPSPTRRGSERSTPRPRRGIALVFVLIFVIAMAALAMSSIFMASNANLLAKSYDRERDLKFAAEAALSIGKSRVNADPNILTMRSAGQLDTAILLGQTLTGADGNALSGIKVNVYVGPTGSTSGQFGRFSSIIAEARDQRGNGFIRRLELTQESFAKFAYWSNSESNGSTTIFFNNGDELWGPVWSNDTISIGSGGAKFHDEVGTTFFVSGASYGVFSKGKKEYQKAIALPSTAMLATLKTIAGTSGWDFASGRAGSNNETSVLDRIEFLAIDLNTPAANDSTDLNEGLFRIYTARNDGYLRGDYPSGSPPSISNVNFCGDWHWARQAGVGGSDTLLFYPASQHNTTWFYNQVRQGNADKNPLWTNATLDATATAAKTESLNTIMTAANARCYLPGDPHLVSVERTSSYTDPLTGLGYASGAIQKGGMDTTFTPTGVTGFWKKYTDTPNAMISGKRTSGEAKYLWPIDRGFNTNAKGVIHFSGNVGLSGTINGRITLYANGSIILLDDLRYANDPVKGVCRDILGMIADKDIVVADNSLNTPQLITGSNYNALDDTQDFTIHGVMMALGTSFRVENYNGGPTNVNGCGATTNGRGCINLSGGIIQQARGAVGTSSGSGFAKRYTYDKCAVVNPPPYFPTTGRFQDNRYLELDPAGFNDKKYFKSITPDP